MGQFLHGPAPGGHEGLSVSPAFYFEVLMNTRTLPLTASSQGSKSDLAHCGISDPISDPMVYNSPGSSVRGIFPGKNTGVSGHILLQGYLFPPKD